MNYYTRIIAAIIFIVSVIAVSMAEVPPFFSSTPPVGVPPEGSPPPGSSPGVSPSSGGQGFLSYNLSGIYTLNGGIAEESDRAFTSEETDTSAIYVTNGGGLTLKNPIITTSGNTSSSDASSFYGLNGAILADKGSKVIVTGGSITTTGSGANGAIPTGSGTVIMLSDMKITASGDGGHGVMATQGGSLTLSDVDIVTTGIHGAPIATDRGSGSVTVTRGTVYSSGADSPGIYSTGIIRVTDTNITSEGTEAAVIEGFNSIELFNTTLKGGVEKTGGVMIYQSFSGDAENGTGSFLMDGGSYVATKGPAFYITNTDANISLTRVDLTVPSGILIMTAGTSRWGTEGKNGGAVTFKADGEILIGSLVTDEISSITAYLMNGSSLTGSVNSAALILDGTSSWTVTGASNLTTLENPDGIAGSSITNIIGNGNTVTYDSSQSGNRVLKGKTYTLVNGGSLIPR